MSALTGTRSTAKKGSQVVIDQFQLPVAANAKIFQGALVVLDAAGRAVPATSAVAGQQCVGRAAALADNTGGSAGAITVPIESGVFKWVNGTAGDAIAAAAVGLDCWAIDDQTVGLTDGYGGARARAGKVIEIDADGGIWVMTGIYVRDVGNSNGAGAQAGSVVSFSIPLAQIAAGDPISLFKPGFAGRILKIQATVTTPATTAGKAATLTPQINPAMGADVAVTGGALALTSANMTPLGATVQGAAVTAGGAFGPGDGISIKASAVTAFVEGTITLAITLA